MERSSIGIVIPTLNEEKTVGKVISEICNLGIPIIVNDGSTDKSQEIANSLGAELVENSKTLGYDKSIENGFKKAIQLNCDYIITMDADGQHDRESLKKILKKLENYDIVVGERRMKQRFSEYMFSFYTKLRWNISDPLSGMKGYRKEVFIKKGNFDTYKSIGTELLAFSIKKRFKVAKIDIDIKERRSNPRFGSVLFANFKIIRALLITIIYFEV